MNLLHLDPESVIQRVKSSEAAARIPSLLGSVLRGAIGFTLVSVAGFCPWIFGINPMPGNSAGMYLTCALVFVVLSGLCLHGLIIGPGTLGRFYALFSTGFLLYAFAWIYFFMNFSKHQGSLLGLFTGTALMSAVFVQAFGAWNKLVHVVTALFLGNLAGYYGGWVVVMDLIGYETKPTMLLWGVCYGLGFGAGLGLALYACQTRTREVLALNGNG